MENSKEDTHQNFETSFFLIFFSLFVFATSNNPERHTSSSAKFPSQNELAFGDISSRRNAIIFNAVSLPNLQVYDEWTLHSKSFNLFSLQYRISNYNDRITQNFINIQRTRLVIEPLFLWRLFHPLFISKKEDLPVLS